MRPIMSAQDARGPMRMIRRTLIVSAPTEPDIPDDRATSPRLRAGRRRTVEDLAGYEFTPRRISSECRSSDHEPRHACLPARLEQWMSVDVVGTLMSTVGFDPTLTQAFAGRRPVRPDGPA